ncbi:MAG TPA: hypothetical protein VGL77_15875 [Armatimonadota bacterium]
MRYLMWIVNLGVYETPSVTQHRMDYLFATPGTRTVTVQVRDTKGRTTVARTTVTVALGAHPLLTRIRVTPETGTTDTIFSFFTTALEDDERIPLGKMRWDWNGDCVFDTPFIAFVADPAPGSGDPPPTLTHQFATPGVQHVIVQVRSFDGTMGTAAVDVVVQ